MERHPTGQQNLINSPIPKYQECQVLNKRFNSLPNRVGNAKGNN
jgi:hypothetical protein